MAVEPPLSRLVLLATSVADDLGYVALADIARLLGTEGPPNYRVIGGHMVTALIARWQLGSGLYRETGDTDLGVPPIVVRDHRLIEQLTDELGYEQIAGDRFARTLDDIPVRFRGDIGVPRQAVIDVLVPAYTSRARQNRKIGNRLVTTEVPGLATALKRPPVTMMLEMHRLGGELLEAKLAFPDEVAALVLKSLATRVRDKGTDVVDIWRCLEVAFAAGVDPGEFVEGDQAEAAAIVRRLFETRAGAGMAAVATEQSLTEEAADARFTRVRALVSRVLDSAAPEPMHR